MQFTYYFRAKMPSDLRAYLGKSEEMSSLKTKEHINAKALARQASAVSNAAMYGPDC